MQVALPAGRRERRPILAVGHAVRRHGLNQCALADEPLDFGANLIRACQPDRAAQRGGGERSFADNGFALGQVVDGVLHDGLRRCEARRQARGCDTVAGVASLMATAAEAVACLVSTAVELRARAVVDTKLAAFLDPILLDQLAVGLIFARPRGQRNDLLFKRGRRRSRLALVGKRFFDDATSRRKRLDLVAADVVQLEIALVIDQAYRVAKRLQALRQFGLVERVYLVLHAEYVLVRQCAPSAVCALRHVEHDRMRV